MVLFFKHGVTVFSNCNANIHIIHFIFYAEQGNSLCILFQRNWNFLRGMGQIWGRNSAIYSLFCLYELILIRKNAIFPNYSSSHEIASKLKKVIEKISN